jgi:hypothetical protein
VTAAHADIFDNWCAAISAADNPEQQLEYFQQLAHDVGLYINDENRGDIADRLFNIAHAYNLADDDAIQSIIVTEFHRAAAEREAEDRERARAWEQADERQARKGNGHDEAPQHDEELGEWNAGEDPGPIPPRQWLLGNQFCRGFISSLVAAGGVGKSALRLVQFISLALGRSLCSQHVFRRCRVLLISLEDDYNELQRRIQAVLDHFDLPRSDLDGWLFCANPRGKLAELKDRQRSIGPLDQRIRRAIERRKPDLVAIDPFVKLHSLGESDSGDMNFVCDLLVQLAVEHEIAVDVPHHVHKGQIEAGDADAGRGSSGIRDAGRLIYTLLPMSEDEAKIFNIDPVDRAAYVRLDAAKVNITARTGKATWFRLVGVPLGNGTAEYPNGDTIQVAEPWSPPDLWAGTDAILLNRILTEIDTGAGDGNFYTVSKGGSDRAAWRVVQRFAPHKTDAQCRQIIAAWLKSELLITFEYDNPSTRKPVVGLKVDSSKRPN